MKFMTVFGVVSCPPVSCHVSSRYVQSSRYRRVRNLPSRRSPRLVVPYSRPQHRGPRALRLRQRSAKDSPGLQVPAGRILFRALGRSYACLTCVLARGSDLSVPRKFHLEIKQMAMMTSNISKVSLRCINYSPVRSSDGLTNGRTIRQMDATLTLNTPRRD